MAEPQLTFLGGTSSGVASVSLSKYKEIIRLYDSGVPISKLRRQVGVRNKTVSDALKAYRELKSGVASINESHITQTDTVFGREYYYAGNAVVAVVNGGEVSVRFDRRLTFEANAILPMGVILGRFRDILQKSFYPKPIIPVDEVNDWLDETESDGDSPDYYVILYSLQFESVTRSAPHD